jgi:hypothetical protein
LGSLDEYAGRACLEVRNDKGRPAGDPCAVFCGSGDQKSWARLCERLITDARASCHRIGKCARVEELARFYDENSGTFGAGKWMTYERWIHHVGKPIAQELACLVTDATKVGPHPDAPRPLPPAPPVGPGPSWIPGGPDSGWLLPIGIVAAAFLFSQRG